MRKIENSSNSKALLDSEADGEVVNEHSQLSSEDLKRVEQYLSSPIHTVKRKPFRPFLMMLGLVGVVVGLSLLSLLISRLAIE